MSTTIADLTRQEKLERIDQLENELAELRASLPNAYRTLFCFRCKPQSKVWIYALTREEAERKLRERMNQDYGVDRWKVVSQKVDTFDHPEKAVNLTDGNLLKSLSRVDAEQLHRDFEEDQKGRNDANRPNGLKTRLERDVEAYRRSSGV